MEKCESNVRVGVKQNKGDIHRDKERGLKLEGKREAKKGKGEGRASERKRLKGKIRKGREESGKFNKK